MAQDQMPYIGSCFEELAEAAEFDVYIRYAREVTAPTCRDTLNNLLSRPEVENTLTTAGQGMHLALKYYLPALLMGPIRHCSTYFHYIDALRRQPAAVAARDQETLAAQVGVGDQETLAQVVGLLNPLQIELRQCWYLFVCAIISRI